MPVMTADEREAFLSAVHVGVLAVERDGRAPLAVPIWYDYRDGEILLWTDRGTVKERAIRKAGRFSFTVQFEELPYKYVTAEGPVVSAETPPTHDEAAGIVRRYLPEDQVEPWIENSLGDDSVLIRMRPERWLSTDYSKD